ncbi:hypothetical protein GLOTRDRAFT_129546 [Gloeophyllum trabeum ATCC 11539]|uniref:Uncharacterized protein n=1 Tax=Gloeophyllum trabeum (strain ATCC 11539 / FP-39264 / Madison 617) TaxID=670483 RepID=S7Q746_GLOTA|nr:uncharacterized protein GLOTRDRAFT_129546 [Gloeophyllum trabeum ATCC 11539]EPQ55263.1 hypothetical protein GLOTRDRAFT_129546 [Gloeophyllum trabeum ATCC 11539]
MYEEALEWDPRDPEKQVLDEQAPDGYIRVDFYPNLDAVDDLHDMLNFVTWDFPLDSDTGDLDLQMVREYFGTDQIIPICSTRFKPFYPANPDKLSALAVHTLTEHGGRLKVVDCPSPERVKWRERRLRLIIASRIFWTIMDNRISMFLFICGVLMFLLGLWGKLHSYAAVRIGIPDDRPRFWEVLNGGIFYRPGRVLGNGA